MRCLTVYAIIDKKINSCLRGGKRFEVSGRFIMRLLAAYVSGEPFQGRRLI